MKLTCSNCDATCFDESKRSSKLHLYEHKKSVKNSDCEKNKIAKYCPEAYHNFNWN